MKEFSRADDFDTQQTSVGVEIEHDVTRPERSMTTLSTAMSCLTSN
jgi:hypothetical protein